MQNPQFIWNFGIREWNPQSEIRNPKSEIPNPKSKIQKMPFSALYGKFASLRKLLFDKGVYRSHALGAPTISVGNITVGGTGKTPFVTYLATLLAEKGEKVCIISRGYKRHDPKQQVLVSDGTTVLSDARTAGDEPIEMARALVGKAIIIADADRVAAAAFALEKFRPTVFLLDDAFQHLRARRDLDIVLIDATNPFGNRKTLPLGILREPLSGLQRARLIVITRANLVSEDNLANVVADVRSLADCPIITSRNEFSKLRDLRSGTAVVDPETPMFAFCAIGNPGNFFGQLRNEAVSLAGSRSFPDHHYYSTDDVAAIESEASASGARTLVTTAKDAVKLNDLKITIPCLVAENKMIFDDEETLRKMCEFILRSAG